MDRRIRRTIQDISNSTQDPLNHNKRGFRLTKWGFWVSVASLLVGIIIGGIGIKLVLVQIEMSKQQDSTSLDIEHFNQLLDKTDTILSKQSQLVRLSMLQQMTEKEIADRSRSGNMRELILSINSVNWLMATGVIMNKNGLASKMAILNKIESILIQQINNPVLTEIDSNVKKWEVLTERVMYTKTFIESEAEYYVLNPEKVAELSFGALSNLDLDMRKTMDAISKDIHMY